MWDRWSADDTEQIDRKETGSRIARCGQARDGAAERSRSSGHRPVTRNGHTEADRPHACGTAVDDRGDDATRIAAARDLKC